jgi:chromosome segregation protein
MIVTKDSHAAIQAIEYLNREGQGTASLLPLDLVRNGPERRDPKPPSWVIVTGRDVVACDEAVQPLRDLLLRDLWIVPPPQGGEDVEEYFRAPARVVSLDGCLLRDHMVIRGGGKDERNTLLLHRSKRIEELQREAEALREAFKKARSEHTRMKRALRETEEEQGKLSRKSSEELVSLQEKEEILLQLDREESHLRKDIERLREEQAMIDSLLAGKSTDTRDLRAALVEAEQRAERHAGPGTEVELSEIRGEKSAIDREIESVRVEEAAIRSLLSENEKRVEWVRRDLEDRAERLRQMGEESRKLEEELTDLEMEEERIREERDRFVLDVERDEGAISETEKGFRSERETLEREWETLEGLRREAEGQTAAMQRLELERNDMANRLGALSERIAEKYGVALSGGSASEPDDPRPTPELKEELQELHRKIANLGHVNFVALDEYEEAERRYGLLRTQRDDLVEGKESLESTIRRINRTARERFLESFGDVRRNFRQTFRILFRGGRADLHMDDGEDPLECDIDMVAQPFGKKLESVELLSGGERALTALALLFAIYQVKPSPFCILDEADAALDDANVDRLLAMLDSFKNDTQFIIITHNKKTMSAANYLYGVTMEEPGVSKVVSVTLEQAGNDGRGDGSRKVETTRV